MNRDYDSGVSNAVSLFVGEEIEKTPAYGMKTLFVVGVHPVEKLASIAKEHDCTHIYTGANQSFQLIDYESVMSWQSMVRGLLELNFWVTLDFDVAHILSVHETGLCEFNKFIPQISVKIPYISLMNYNACVKIDDKDYNASNPGVWIHNLNELMDRNKFTTWDQYKNDKIIE
jgi:hypothetical protein